LHAACPENDDTTCWDHDDADIALFDQYQAEY
jgi:hypothetical protein